MRDLISKGLLTAAAASSVLSLTGGYAIAVESDGVAAKSPGVLSGNTVQAPIEVPVNVCGNTVDVAGVGNPAFGNGCGSTSGRTQQSATREGSSSHPSHPSDQAPPANRASAPEGHDDRTPDAPQGPDHGPVSTPQDAPAHTPQRHETPTHPHQGAYAHQGSTGAGASASAVAKGSPGLGSGNVVQAPIDIPVNVCGNSVNLIGILNPAFGNRCENGSPALPDVPRPPVTPPAPQIPETPGGEEPGGPQTPPVPATPPGDRDVPEPVTPVTHPREEFPAPVTELASTGSDAGLLGMGVMSAALLLGGGILYRRGTARARV